ncbi:phosphoribosylanthranilate isomerase [Mesobacillus harenae]|uniref:phosphoribosylanthranilate isomerase n=1 Tax=Mesobacillus harenae TaxID=2213203 RepID=UPI001580F49E|nr:phosphoribosylanthranilate isomerase [Mesobacillus harenae]
MKVKICGIMDPETADFTVKAGADALGFVFAESRRRIAPQVAKKIIGKLPEEIWKVGVFVNETAENIHHIFETAGLTHVQLHGDESAEFSSSLGLPVIKSIGVQSEEDLEKISARPEEIVLLDSPAGQFRGGNGTSFDWQLALNLGIGEKRIILAGGLNPENVNEAIRAVKPYMVDVSSGVETNGIKDRGKISAFLEQAKR